MISKALQADSFYHTCRYVCNKPGAEVLLAEGVRGHDYKLMAEDFLNQQQMRPSKQKACLHAILSFYPGEKPSDETLKEITLKYLAGLGVVNTQFAVSKHTDKAHLHLHIVANMVNNHGKAISDSWIGLRGKKVAQKLTQEYQLIPALKKNLDLTHLEALSQSEADKYTIYQAIAENLPLCRTMTELEGRLLLLGIETQYKYKKQTQERQGVSFKLGDYCFKGSQIDRRFSLAGLEKILTEQQRNRQVTQEIPKVETGEHLPLQPSNGLIKKQKSPKHSPEDIKLGQAIDVGKTLGNAIEILTHPEYSGGPMPYELTQDYLRRKKKKGRRNRH